MLNTDLFKFEFVDRIKEREIVAKFIDSFKESKKYALWIHGKRGTGKSYFLTEYIVPQNSFTTIYVEIKMGCDTSGTYLKELIAQINKAADLKFMNFLRANYNSVAEIGQKAFNVILNLADLNDIGLDELSLSFTNFFISKKGEKENSTLVVKKYIGEALKKCHNLVFIFDNFSLCDSFSLDIISTITHEMMQETNIRFLFCTTDDDMENRFDIKAVLAEKIANKPVEIKSFNQKQLFIRMLEHSFELNEQNIDLLSQTFELCQGIPQRFKEILINLYVSQGIDTNGNKAKFIVETFQQIIVKHEICFDIDSLCQQHKSAKIILQVIALWNEPISSDTLFQFLGYYANIDPLPLLKEEISNTIIYLENIHVLTKTYNGNTVLYQFKHDSLKVAVNAYFKNDRSIPFLHFNIYEFIKTLDNSELSKPYWCQNYRSLLAYHSYASKADRWIEYNYLYGCFFYQKNLYEQAQVIYSRLETEVTSLSGEQLLTMAITFYYCGQYRKAIDFLKIIQSNNLMDYLSKEQIIMLYIFEARSYYCILEIEHALERISKAEVLCAEDERQNVITLGIKQNILFLSPNGFNQAKELFDELTKKNIHIREMALIYQSAMDYYEGDEAQKLLNMGLSLAREFSDEITEAKILNNMGFEFLRCSNYDEAQCLFEKCISILKNVQPHEQAYAYSNLSVLYMISKEWELALNSIIEALFWNKSEYVSLVLKTNRMLCYYFLGNQEWEKIYKELMRYIEIKRNIDDKIYKKICINLAIIASKNGDILDVEQLLGICKPHLENEWQYGKYRFTKLEQHITGTEAELSKPSDPRYNQYYCELEFEPWLVNFTHD